MSGKEKWNPSKKCVKNEQKTSDFEPKCIKPILSSEINDMKFKIYEMNHEYSEAEKFCAERDQFLFPIEKFDEKFSTMMQKIGHEIKKNLNREIGLRFWIPLKRSSNIAGKVEKSLVLKADLYVK